MIYNTFGPRKVDNYIEKKIRKTYGIKLKNTCEGDMIVLKEHMAKTHGIKLRNT
jgi:hypothetical protein